MKDMAWKLRILMLNIEVDSYWMFWRIRVFAHRYFTIRAFVLMALFLLTLLFCGISRADNCQDPDTLTPQMKKAYYELKRASDELGGFSVSIKCYPPPTHIQIKEERKLNHGN